MEAFENGTALGAVKIKDGLFIGDQFVAQVLPKLLREMAGVYRV